jgi:uncharacterized membrane protein
VIWLLACAVAEEDSAADPCAEAPYADWETFGKGFVTESCQACHGSQVTAEDRHGAPAGVSFDTAAGVWANAERVLAKAGSEPPSMPPMGGTTEGDRELLRAWLACGVEGE